jgi:hypothetical protein
MAGYLFGPCGVAPAVVVAGISPSLDGSNTVNAGSGGVVTIPLTTAGSSGVIVVAMIVAGSVTVDPTATGLTFTQRSVVGPVGGNFVYVYTAPYSAPFSGNISLTTGAGQFTTASAFGVTGCPTTSYFDADASLPADNSTASATASASFSTAHAKDFVYFIACSQGAGNDTPTGLWQSISGSNFLTVFYQIVSSTQASQTVTGTNGVYDGSIVDAIVGL